MWISFSGNRKKESENFQCFPISVLMLSMELSGKRALVTGGALRIGRAIVEALQTAGVEVVVHYRHSAKAAADLSHFTVQADLAVPEECAALLPRINDQFGPVDILVNNASVFSKDTLTEASPDKVQTEFQTNLFAPLELTRAFAVQTNNGAVINLLDRRIRCNDTTSAPYSITKKALEDLTCLAALEYAPRIAVNAVAPGPVLPPPGSETTQVRELAGNIPLDRIPDPAEIATAALFLLQADSITGQVVYVDGGQHLLGNGV